MAINKPFSLRITPSTEFEWVISVSKKVSKKATIRNLVKRRVRAVLRDLSPSLTPAKYLLVARSGAELVKGAELRQELAALLKKS